MSLRNVLIGFAALILLICFSVGALYFNRGLSDYGARAQQVAVEVRGQALSEFVSSALLEEWNYVAGFAESLDLTGDTAVLQATVDAYRDTGNKISWAGIVQTGGTVVAATENMLVGQNVGQRPWFQRGLEGPFAGDVHEAVLLADLIAPGAEVPPRFVDFALPLTNEAGQVRGVFGVHINWEWVQSLVERTAATLEMDAFLMSANGEVLISTDPEISSENVGTLASFRTANLQTQRSMVEQWPDGQTYYSFTVPQVSADGLPSFGWSLVLRLDPTFLTGGEQNFARIMIIGGGMMLLAALLAMALLFSITIRPLTGLVDAISDLSKGQQVGFVPETQSYREVAKLSNAIARLQTRDDRQ
ncbi:cache domain-containing protein [Pelagibacterium lentulum]|uniref:HAMP domain-containing protein n=1 Tax=Pelagibacterium lentulum TaxID=2029865 RepID=A0A916VXU6_9HYPH|nr:cache domain-containing protein [Pelagibacterium lentulum]GGA50552.1 hypothetical protein GCM10011499_20640 [Pelagibacterium lentulum]